MIHKIPTFIILPPVEKTAEGKCKIEETGVKVFLLVAASMCIILADKCDGRYC
jgi:hypothetical protein